MRHKKDETPSVRGQGFQETTDIDQAGDDCATLGSGCDQQEYRIPIELALYDLPSIPRLSCHGRRHPRAGGDGLTEVQFENALSGFVLGDVVLESYSKAETFDERCSVISNGMLIAQEEDIKDNGIIRGFAAYIAALIEGYAALAQGATGVQEVLQ